MLTFLAAVILALVIAGAILVNHRDGQPAKPRGNQANLERLDDGGDPRAPF